MILGVCIILIIAFCMAMAFTARRYRDEDESDSGFIASLFVVTVFAIGGFFLLLFLFNILSHDIR